MFKQLFFLAVLMFIPPLSFADLADHTFETSIEEYQLYIIAQIEIRDSNEHLVGYIETDRVIIQNFEGISLILDDMSGNPENTKIIIIDNKPYEIITGVGNAEYTSETTVSISGITNNGKTLAFANYDGFVVREGDLVFTTWTMVRPA